VKELSQHIKPGIEIQAQKQIDKKKLFIGNMSIRPGMKCYEMNFKTGEISEAKYDSVDIVVTGGAINKISRKIITKENCLYCVAINKNNAEKKFLKLFKLPKP